jgi:hypothetical protein
MKTRNSFSQTIYKNKGKFLHNMIVNVVSPMSLDVVFKKIGFVIQKGLVAQLIARLSFIHV